MFHGITHWPFGLFSHIVFEIYCTFRVTNFRRLTLVESLQFTEALLQPFLAKHCDGVIGIDFFLRSPWAYCDFDSGAAAAASASVWDG